MSRRHSAEKREILPDPLFNDVIVTKFINNLMYDGKKSTAEKDRLQAFERSSSRGPAAIRCRPSTTPLSTRAGYRGPVPARRRRDLPGPRRGQAEPRAGAGHPLADPRRPVALGDTP